MYSSQLLPSLLSALPFTSLQAGWLQDLEDWLLQAIKAVLAALFELLKTVFLWLFDQLADFVVYVFQSITPPDFLSQYSIGTLLGQAGPVIGWLASSLQLGTCLGIIAGAYAFRLLRKLLTLGQW